jgi:hypothetical protein
MERFLHVVSLQVGFASCIRVFRALDRGPKACLYLRPSNHVVNKPDATAYRQAEVRTRPTPILLPFCK